jgi:transcriptional regulator with XRE-family HTH domain
VKIFDKKIPSTPNPATSIHLPLSRLRIPRKVLASGKGTIYHATMGFDGEPFGEQLRRAREARGLTLKEVEDAIKIREDFLREFEQGNFDFPLPDIYKRGFFRVYAEFLELNIDPWLEQMDSLDGQGPMVDGEKDGESATATRSRWKTWLWARCCNRRWQCGALAVILALPLLFSLFHSTSATDAEWADLLRSEAGDVVAVAPLPAKKLALVASDGVQVLVRTKESKKKIFSGLLKKGATEMVEYGESVQISFSEGSALSVRTESGEVVRPRKAGVGWLEVAY